MAELPKFTIKATATDSGIQVKITESDTLDDYAGAIQRADLLKNHPLLCDDSALCETLRDAAAGHAVEGIAVQFSKECKRWRIRLSCTALAGKFVAHDELEIICAGPLVENYVERLRKQVAALQARVREIEEARKSDREAILADMIAMRTCGMVQASGAYRRTEFWSGDQRVVWKFT